MIFFFLVKKKVFINKKIFVKIFFLSLFIYKNTIIVSFLVQLSYISIQTKTPHYYFINLENQVNTLNSNPLLYLVLSLNNISCSYIFCFLFYLRFSFAEFILKKYQKMF